MDVSAENGQPRDLTGPRRSWQPWPREPSAGAGGAPRRPRPRRTAPSRKQSWGWGGGKSPRLPAISERASDRAASPKTAQHLASGTGDEPLFLSSHSVTSPSRRNWEKRPGAKSVRTTVTPPAPRQLPGDQARAGPRHVLTSAPDSGWGAGGRQTCPLAARGSPPRLYKQHLER